MCTRVGVLDRGRMVLQDDVATLVAPTGRVVVHTSQVDWACELLGHRVESVGPGQIVVTSTDPAGINALLVGAGLSVSEIGPLRISLEDVVLRASESA